MEYIVLDTEWNNAFCKSEGKFINELIEIGAVKLNYALEEISSFKCIIKSQLSKNLSLRFKDLTNISNEEMATGISFDEAIKKYTQWAGNDAVTMTWSNSDIYVLLENCCVFSGYKKIPCISKYADLQKFVQNELILLGKKINSQISLTCAAELLMVSTDDMSLHRAIDDSILSAQLFRKVFNRERFEALIIDTSEDDYYERLTYKPYVISDIDSPLIDKQSLKFKCDQCNFTAKRVTKWHFKNGCFRAKFVCQNCKNQFLGRVAYKKYYDKITIKKMRLSVPTQIAGADGPSRT